MSKNRHDVHWCTSSLDLTARCRNTNSLEISLLRQLQLTRRSFSPTLNRWWKFLAAALNFSSPKASSPSELLTTDLIFVITKFSRSLKSSNCSRSSRRFSNYHWNWLPTSQPTPGLLKLFLGVCHSNYKLSRSVPTWLKHNSKRQLFGIKTTQ